MYLPFVSSTIFHRFCPRGSFLSVNNSDPRHKCSLSFYFIYFLPPVTCFQISIVCSKNVRTPNYFFILRPPVIAFQKSINCSKNAKTPNYFYFYFATACHRFSETKSVNCRIKRVWPKVFSRIYIFKNFRKKSHLNLHLWKFIEISIGKGINMIHVLC